MKKIRQTPAKRFFGYYPGTVAVVSVATKTERNVMSAGWHAALSFRPPLYGVAIGEERYTHRLVKEAGSFAVNFLPFEEAKTIAAVGSVSLHEGRDKFERFMIATEAPLVTNAPVLKAAYLSYECELEAIWRTGDHDWFVGNIKAVHFEPECYDDRWLLDSARRSAAIYYGRAEYQALEGGRRAVFPPEGFKGE